MWEYFLLDYMANVVFSGAKHRQDTKREQKYPNYYMKSFFNFVKLDDKIYRWEVFLERNLERIIQGSYSNKKTYFQSS